MVKIKMIHNLIYEHLVVIVLCMGHTAPATTTTITSGQYENYDNFNYFAMHKLWDLFGIFLNILCNFFSPPACPFWTTPSPATLQLKYSCLTLPSSNNNELNMQKRHFRIIIELEKSEIIMIMITWTYANLYLISNHYFKQIQLTRCHYALWPSLPLCLLISV